MHMLENRLHPEEKADKEKRKRVWFWQKDKEHQGKGEQIHTVWFDAWQYDQQEMLWAALVLEILRQVREQLKWYQRVGLFFRLNVKRFDWSAFWGDLFRSVGIAFVLSLASFGAYSLFASVLALVSAN